VCSAVIHERGNSTARKTAMTTISIMVVLLASLCRLSLLSLLNPNMDILLAIVLFLEGLAAPAFLKLLFVLFTVRRLLLCSALRIAEKSNMLRITRETQGKT